jgi:hypothetical protein
MSQVNPCLRCHSNGPTIRVRDMYVVKDLCASCFIKEVRGGNAGTLEFTLAYAEFQKYWNKRFVLGTIMVWDDLDMDYIEWLRNV